MAFSYGCAEDASVLNTLWHTGAQIKANAQTRAVLGWAAAFFAETSCTLVGGGLEYKQSDNYYALVLHAVQFFSAPYSVGSKDSTFKRPMAVAHQEHATKAQILPLDAAEWNERGRKKFDKSRNKTCMTWTEIRFFLERCNSCSVPDYKTNMCNFICLQ